MRIFDKSRVKSKQVTTTFTSDETIRVLQEKQQKQKSHIKSLQTKLNQKDGWTVTTRDGRLSAQWEHTIAVTDTGIEVLTARSDEVFPFEQSR